jgi:hypothetical protein
LEPPQRLDLLVIGPPAKRRYLARAGACEEEQGIDDPPIKWDAPVTDQGLNLASGEDRGSAPERIAVSLAGQLVLPNRARVGVNKPVDQRFLEDRVKSPEDVPHSPRGQQSAPLRVLAAKRAHQVANMSGADINEKAIAELRIHVQAKVARFALPVFLSQLAPLNPPFTVGAHGQRARLRLACISERLHLLLGDGNHLLGRLFLPERQTRGPIDAPAIDILEADPERATLWKDGSHAISHHAASSPLGPRALRRLALSRV